MSEKLTAFDEGTVLTYEVDDTERLSDGIVAAVSAVANVDPLALDPLADRIDPDALDALFADKFDGTTRTAGRVQFPYADHVVVVTGAGLISVFDSDG